MITTKRAELEHEGFINTMGGKGTFVAPQDPEFLRKKRTKAVEEKLAEAVGQARLLHVGSDKLSEMLRLGRDEEALAVLEAGIAGGPFVDVPGSLLRGQLYERRGEHEQAIRAYSRVVDLWRDCDPGLVPQREVAGRALERLLAEG